MIFSKIYITIFLRWRSCLWHCKERLVIC
ncbi:hypothetical protein PR048_009098 [Dryococelus australis]|uniref:Uncharacterized protein n=1 Tax=Dryococelus australis TaxID=614101 RepID=A0ABQ9I0T1_9NEOP|nr:hypothetical protein PR048_009098 [Dryococelus australis]